ncbi:MAG TPA: GGDEF domain-containing protein [Rhizomicrobium sp.]|nr:GGDEF domain-containing protein [Rhizomicrobium sp.]
MYKPEREQALAKTAVALMGECNVAATPDNFELFYAYASGDNPAIAQVMGAQIAGRQPFTPALLQDLRTRCLSSARTAKAMETVGTNMNDVITAVMMKLEAAGREAVHYSNQLNAASGELGMRRSPDDLRELVGGLIGATRAMEERTKSLEGELQRSSQQVNELRTKLDSVRKESLTDPLTGIANRKAFDDAVGQAMEQIAQGQQVSLLLCDIDHFKKFNDTWGHQTGDQVLKLVAGCLSENVKGRDTAARYGGEEFAVLLRGIGLADAARIADQIRTTVETKKLVKKSTGDILGSITISIGVAQFHDGEGIEGVVRRADACLYGAKHHGRNLMVHENDPRMAALETSAA